MLDILTCSKTISTWGRTRLFWGRNQLPSPSTDCINFLKPAYSKKQPRFLWKQPGNSLYRVFSKYTAHEVRRVRRFASQWKIVKALQRPKQTKRALIFTILKSRRGILALPIVDLNPTTFSNRCNRWRIFEKRPKQRGQRSRCHGRDPRSIRAVQGQRGQR